MTPRGVAIVIAVSATSCMFAACGGGSDNAAAPAVGDGFAERAAAVCQKALNAKEAWQAFPVSNFDPAAPDPADFAQVAPWLKQQVAPTFDAWLSGLRALGQPKTGAGAWRDTIAVVARIDRDNRTQITAAERGNTKAFAAATTDLSNAQGDLERATDAAGVPKCADVHKG